MTFLLGPATVALAIPLYKNRQTFFRNLVPAGAGLLAGSLGTMIAAGLVARIFRFTPELVSSIAIKSTTVPIAVEVAKIVHGNPTLTAALVVITGMIGASFGALMQLGSTSKRMPDAASGLQAPSTAFQTADEVRP
jgi:putative effector of murein hydrolase